MIVGETLGKSSIGGRAMSSAKLDETLKEYVKKFGEGLSFGYHSVPEEKLIELLEKAIETGTPLPDVSDEFTK